MTDAEVDETLERMREQHAEFRSVERAAATGDLVIVDYTLAPEGHEPSTATGYHFLVGSGTVLPEIDEAVIGLTAGQERDVPRQLRRRPPQRVAARQGRQRAPSR